MNNNEISTQLNLLTPITTQKVVVFDIETQLGFDDTKKISDMGVAVAVTCDAETNEYNYFTEHNVPELIEELFSADVVVGYNILSFDYKVLEGYTDKDFSKIKSVDMMRLVQKELGFRPKLDNLVGATIGDTKSANGLQSLIWYKEGKIDLIKEYCYHDVRLTKELYEHGKNNGFVYANNYDDKVKVPVSW